MKRIIFLLSILILFILGACNLRAPAPEAPKATPPPPATAVEAPAEGLVPTALPTFTATAVLVVTEPPVAEALAAPSPTSTQPVPYPAPATQPVQPTPIPPTATLAAPTTTPTTAAPFDPYITYGKPKYQNRMEFPNLGEWAQAETEELPNNRNIRLEFDDGELIVTGKRPDFSTWWFSYHTLSDAFIEMTFESEDCFGQDAYGFIFRGPPHKAGESYGYAVSFTCDGSLWVLRLDGVNPWDAQSLLDEEEVSPINTGSYEENVIGVRAEGEKFIVYANGRQVAELEDDEFDQGRVGVFVRPGAGGAYTYRVTNFAYWIFVD